MEVLQIRNLTDILTDKKTAVALGNFDGVHLAHRELLFEACRHLELHPSVFTFKNRTNGFITTLDDRLCEFEKCGIKTVFLADFELFRKLSPEAFAEFLKKNLSCELAICGFNFKFGYMAKGTAETLSSLSQILGFSALVLPEKTLNKEKVSSSEIRKALADGNLEKANAMLTRPFSLSGKVARGYSIGKKLDAPTMNLEVPEGLTDIKNGVYVTECEIGRALYPSVTNIGKNPTFEKENITCETHLLNVTGDFYNKEHRVYFLHFLRDEKKFDTSRELMAQISNDIKNSLDYHNQKIQSLSKRNETK